MGRRCPRTGRVCVMPGKAVRLIGPRSPPTAGSVGRWPVVADRLTTASPQRLRHTDHVSVCTPPSCHPRLRPFNYQPSAASGRPAGRPGQRMRSVANRRQALCTPAGGKMSTEYIAWPMDFNTLTGRRSGKQFLPSASVSVAFCSAM